MEALKFFCLAMISGIVYKVIEDESQYRARKAFVEKWQRHLSRKSLYYAKPSLN